MSISNGVVSTSLTWFPNVSSPSNRSGINLKYTTFTHRTRPNLGVLRLDVSDLNTHASDVVTVTNVLDGAGSWRTTAVGSGVLPNSTDGTIYSAVRPNGIQNVTAYEISTLDFVSSSPGHPIPAHSISNLSAAGCFIDPDPHPSTASQCYTIHPSPSHTQNGSFTVIKYVGIASSDVFPTTELHTAHTATTSALSLGYDALLNEHTHAWEAIWEDSDIVIPGDREEEEEMQLVTRASLFHLLSNVREGKEGAGLGDNSIAPAGLTSDSYAGQVFWDAVSPFPLPSLPSMMYLD